MAARGSRVDDHAFSDAGRPDAAPRLLHDRDEFVTENEGSRRNEAVRNSRG